MKLIGHFGIALRSQDCSPMGMKWHSDSSWTTSKYVKLILRVHQHKHRYLPLSCPTRFLFFPEWAQVGDHHAFSGSVHALFIFHAWYQTQGETGPTVSTYFSCIISVCFFFHCLSHVPLFSAGWRRLWLRCPKRNWANMWKPWCLSFAVTTCQMKTLKCPMSDTPSAELHTEPTHGRVGGKGKGRF